MKRIIQIILILFIIHCSFFTTNAQVAINTDNSLPDASAMLDVKSTDKGVLIPRMASAQRTAIMSAATGLLVFDTTTESFWFKDNTTWVELVSGNVASLRDGDSDTKIELDANGIDEDKIRIDIEGVEVVELDKNSNDDFIISPISNNIILGNTSGTANTGGGNIFIGEEAGRMNTTGGSNVFVGDEAGRNNMTTGGNVFIGNEAGRSNTMSSNVYVGSTAGQQNISGTQNVMIGSSTGQVSTGSGNVFMGYRTGRFETGSNKLYIDNTETIDPLIYGEFDNHKVKINGSFETTGSAKIGLSGTTLSSIIKRTSASVSIGSIGGNSGLIHDFSVSGAAVGGVVSISPRTSLGGQIVIAQAWVSAVGIVSVRFRNTDSGSKNPGTITYDIAVIQ